MKAQIRILSESKPLTAELAEMIAEFLDSRGDQIVIEKQSEVRPGRKGDHLVYIDLEVR